MENERNSDEPHGFWTSYILRRLKEDGISDLDNFFEGARVEVSAREGYFHGDLNPVVDLSFCSMRRLARNDLLDVSLYRGIEIDRDSSIEEIFEGIQFDRRDKKALSDHHFRYHKESGFNVYGDFELADLPERLQKYYNKDGVDPTGLVDDIITCVKEIGILPEQSPSFFLIKRDYSGKVSVFNEKDMSETSLEEYASSQMNDKIDELLKVTKNLEKIASQHPIVLKEEGKYLTELYTQAINSNVDNIRFFEYKGQRIPYILVNSVDLEGVPGKAFYNLYLVARDKAPEEWQQQIIAYHESLCVRIGHNNARRKELALARHLGKEKEYRKWRKDIDNGF